MSQSTVGQPPSGSWPGSAPDERPTGPGSIATFGPRVVAFVVDGIAANLLVGITYVGGWHPGPGARGWLVFAAFLLLEVIGVAAVGQTPGMRVARLVVTTPTARRPRLQWVLLRTALLAVVVPALLTDRKGRAMHERAAGTVMLRTG